MDRSVDVGEIVRRWGPASCQRYGARMPIRQRRAMHAIEVCRTAALGGHVEACDHCGRRRISYNSCRNRHCPKCQALATARWLHAQEAALLPVPYVHVVFTLPEEVRPVALRNQRVVYNILFRAASETLLELARDPTLLGAQIGCIAMLHTWSQTLLDHPHLHCLVPGGGLSLDGRRWIAAKPGFFLPVAVMACLFRGKFLAALRQAYDAGTLVCVGKIASLTTARTFQDLLHRLYGTDWVVYCKPPYGSPEQVLAYLGRYTHRVAISNERIIRLEGDQVTFRYRDRADGDTLKEMTLSAEEFLRRFLLHILPEGFVKIRHYGLLSTRNRKTHLQQARQLLGFRLSAPDAPGPPPTWQDLLAQLTGLDPRRCPACGTGQMVLIERLTPQPIRAPPDQDLRVT